MNQERVKPPLQYATQTLNVTVLLPNVSQAGKSKGACVVCISPYKSGTTVTIPSNVRLDLLIMFNMYVAEGCVICLSHLDKKNIKPDITLENSPRKTSEELIPSDAPNLIQKLLEFTQTSLKRPYLDFLDPTMSDEDYISWTGWNKEQFQYMFGYLVEMRESSSRDKTTALAMFWVKLKTGLSFGQICSLFNLHPVQQNQRVADAIHTVSEQLPKFFVPEHLGVESLTMYSM